jgi:catechol 2,3-dioxygenase-like lactoylglutathione lyase family enzyme
VPQTGIFVEDQETALDFLTDKLGLEEIQDEPYSEGTRWVMVSPKGARMTIALRKAEKAHEKAMVGRSDGAPVLILGTDDARAAYERLTGLGVRFLREPHRYPWGLAAILLDQDGSPCSCSKRKNPAKGRWKPMVRRRKICTAGT